MALIWYRFAANALTGARAIASLVLIARPSLALVAFAIATDWIDGSFARRSGDTSYGARFDLEADSLLTVGTAIAAVRSGAPLVALIAPLARYAVAGVRDPRSLSHSEIVLDRATGGPLMAVLIAWLAPRPFGALRVLTGPSRWHAASPWAPSPPGARYTRVSYGDRRRPAWSFPIKEDR